MIGRKKKRGIEKIINVISDMTKKIENNIKIRWKRKPDYVDIKKQN